MDPSKPSESFSLNVEDAAFSARQASIFGSLPVVKLNSLEEDSTSLRPDETEEENEDVMPFKGEESIFKRPMPKLKRPSHKPRKNYHPNSNRMKVPDHKKNPEKWIRYSLESTSDVTNKSNSAAALSFLREIADRKRKSENVEEEETAPGGKILFKKPKNKEDKSQASRTYRDGKLCMPAFEFGSKKTKSAKKIKDKSAARKTQERTLAHLAEEGDEDEVSTNLDV